MNTATCILDSASPYSQSKIYDRYHPKQKKETDDAYEERTWRERCHRNDAGEIVIPQMALMKTVHRAAEVLTEKIPGKGNSTYTKHFRSGLLVTENPVAINSKGKSILWKDIEGEWLHLGARGKNSATRVWRHMPVIHQWSCTVTYHILDAAITEELFTRYLQEAGRFVGLGRFRPENGGFYGRFTVREVAWI